MVDSCILHSASLISSTLGSFPVPARLVFALLLLDLSSGMKGSERPVSKLRRSQAHLVLIGIARPLARVLITGYEAILILFTCRQCNVSAAPISHSLHNLYFVTESLSTILNLMS